MTSSIVRYPGCAAMLEEASRKKKKHKRFYLKYLLYFVFKNRSDATERQRGFLRPNEKEKIKKNNDIISDRDPYKLVNSSTDWNEMAAENNGARFSNYSLYTSANEKKKIDLVLTFFCKKVKGKIAISFSCYSVCYTNTKVLCQRFKLNWKHDIISKKTTTTTTKRSRI